MSGILFYNPVHNVCLPPTSHRIYLSRRAAKFNKRKLRIWYFFRFGFFWIWENRRSACGNAQRTSVYSIEFFKKARTKSEIGVHFHDRKSTSGFWNVKPFLSQSIENSVSNPIKLARITRPPQIQLNSRFLRFPECESVNLVSSIACPLIRHSQIRNERSRKINHNKLPVSFYYVKKEKKA